MDNPRHCGRRSNGPACALDNRQRRVGPISVQCRVLERGCCRWDNVPLARR